MAAPMPRLMPSVMQRSYSEKSSKSLNGPGPNVPWPRTDSARAAKLVQRRRAAVRRVDHERRVAERARAPLVAQEGFAVDRAVAARVLLDRTLQKVLVRQRLLSAVLLRAV